MSSSEQTAESDRRFAEKGVDRLVFFSDAVVAIAITLVVLPLVDTARDVGTETTAEFFTKNAFAFLAAGISFVVIGQFWRDHHRIFNRAIGYNRLLMRINEVWLAGIVFLPLATVLTVGARHGDVLANVAYIATIGVTMLAERFENIVLHRFRLLEPTTDPEPAGVARLEGWIPIMLLVVALVLTIVVPDAGLWSLLVLVLGRPASRLARRVE